MPTITFTVEGPGDGTGTLRFRARENYTTADGEIVTTRDSLRVVPFTVNDPAQVELPSGQWEVSGLATKTPLPFDVGSGNANLKDLIVFGLPSSAPATSLSAAVTAWMDANAEGAITDPLMAALVADPTSEVKTTLDASYAPLASLARTPDSLIAGAVTRNSDGVVTSAPVLWPDGTPGTYTTTTIDPTGAVNAYTITYGSPVTKTFTQPTITRDSSGAATNVPAVVVS